MQQRDTFGSLHRLCFSHRKRDIQWRIHDAGGKYDG
jgi:hypothetical protein